MKPPSKVPARRARSAGSDSRQEVLPGLEGVIDNQVGDMLPQGSRREIVRRITSVVYSEQFSGPIAHPRHLREYEDILPGTADRIVSMAERQSAHLIEMNKAAFEAEKEDRKRGMLFGLGAFVLLIGCAFGSLFVTESPIIPGLFLGAAAVGGVALFVNGRGGSR